MIGKKCGFVLLALGILAIIIGVVIEVVPEQMMPDLLRSNLAIVPTSKTFEPWSNPGKLPVTMEFRFFNIKNNLDTKSSGESTDTPVEEGGMPIVEEKGPYVYRETRVRSNVSFNDEQTELSYSEKTKFVFDEKASAGKEDDMIYGLNMPLLTVFGLLGQIDPSKAIMVKIIFNGMASRRNLKVVQRKSVQDWLWGSESTILKELQANKAMLPPEMQAKATITEFGYMMDNGAASHYVIGTGYKDLKDVAQIKKYNGKTKLDYWGSRYSNKIQGTDGTIFHPNVDAKETLFMFSADICRSIYAKSEGEEVVEGVKTLVFTPPSDVFAAPEDNPDNEGFCQPKPCLGSGLLRVTNCRHDAPLVISQPHLCDADKNVQKTVKGIKPDPSKHKTRLYLVPTLGVMIKAHKRLQFNAILLPPDGYDLTAKLKKDQIVPLFWVQEGFTGDKEFASMVQSSVNMIEFFPKNGKAIFYALTATGLILILIAFFAVLAKPKDEDGYNVNLVPTVRMSSVAKNQDQGSRIHPKSQEIGYSNKGYRR